MYLSRQTREDYPYQMMRFRVQNSLSYLTTSLTTEEKSDTNYLLELMIKGHAELRKFILLLRHEMVEPVNWGPVFRWHLFPPKSIVDASSFEVLSMKDKYSLVYMVDRFRKLEPLRYLRTREIRGKKKVNMPKASSLIKEHVKLEQRLMEMSVYIRLYEIYVKEHDVKKYFGMIAQAWEQARILFRFEDEIFFPWIHYFVHFTRFVDTVDDVEAPAFKKLIKDMELWKERTKYHEILSRELTMESVEEGSSGIGLHIKGVLEDESSLFDSHWDSTIHLIDAPDPQKQKQEWAQFVVLQKKRHHSNPKDWVDWYNSQMEAYTRQFKRLVQDRKDALKREDTMRAKKIYKQLQSLLRKMTGLKKIRVSLGMGISTPMDKDRRRRIRSSIAGSSLAKGEDVATSFRLV
jgi:hypothetical protein